MPDPKKYRTYKPYQQVQNPSDVGPVNIPAPKSNPYKAPDVGFSMDVRNQNEYGNQYPFLKESVNEQLRAMSPQQRREFVMWAEQEMNNLRSEAEGRFRRSIHPVGNGKYDFSVSQEQAYRDIKPIYDDILRFKEAIDSANMYEMGIRNVPQGATKPWRDMDARYKIENRIP